MQDKELFEYFGFDVSLTAEEADKEYYKQFDDEKFMALHPFSLSCEGIWDTDVYMWFTKESYYQARMEV